MRVENKKKKYCRPALLVEEFSPETTLCSCMVINHQMSEALQCGYELEGLGFNIFAQAWVDCQLPDTAAGGFSSYCYMPGANNLFSS